MALTSRKATTTITDIGVEAFFRLGDKLVGIGNLGSVGNLLVCGICLAKADVVLEGSIEKNSLLVDVTYQLAKVVYGEVFHVDAVDEHFTFLYVIVTRYQIHHCTLAATTLTYQCHGLSLRDN